MKIFGIPVFGVILPYIGRRRIPLNRDLSVVNPHDGDILDTRGFYYVEPWVFEWLGQGFGLTNSVVRRMDTGEPVLEEDA